MTSQRRIWIIFVKETIDNLRDHRSVASSLGTSFMSPLLMIMMIMLVGRTVMSDMTETPLELPIQGAEHAPGLMAFLTENNVVVKAAPADPQAAVREGEESLVLLIDADYGEAFTQGRPAPMRLVYDSTRQSSIPAIERTNTLLQAYSGTIGSLRLQARGVDPRLSQVIAVERADIATPQDRAVLFLYILPFLLIMTIFIGAMYVIIDTTAGERERGSLEPLLINPVPRREMVVAKLLASLPFALVTLALTLALLWAGFNLIPLEDYIGMQMNIDWRILMNIFWLCVPVVLLASALQMVVASYTRSFKEAQTYLSLLPLVAGIPSIFIGFMPVKMNVWNALIPIFSQSLLMNQLLRGETVQPELVMVATLSTLLAGVLFTVLAIRLYERENILFGGK